MDRLAVPKIVTTLRIIVSLYIADRVSSRLLGRNSKESDRYREKDLAHVVWSKPSVPRGESVSTREKISAINYNRRPGERSCMSETDRQAMNRGIDVEQLQTFMAHASAHPEAIEFELGARRIDEGRPAHGTTEVGSYRFGGTEIGRDDRERLQELVPLSATLNLLSRPWDIESAVSVKELD